MNKIKKIYQKVVSVISIFLLMFTCYILIAGTIAAKKGTMMNIFGYTYSVVPTSSMEPVINVGDSVIGKVVDYDTLEVGDDIIYHYVNDTTDIYIVHRIIRKDENGFKTQGVNPSITTEDEIYVTEDNFVAKVVWSGKLANIGTLILNHRGAILLVVVAILLLIAFNGIFDIIKIINEQKRLDAKDKIKEELLEDYKNKIRKELEEEKIKMNNK